MVLSKQRMRWNENLRKKTILKTSQRGGHSWLDACWDVLFHRGIGVKATSRKGVILVCRRNFIAQHCTWLIAGLLWTL